MRAQRVECVLPVRVHALRAPPALRRREQRAGPDQHHVRECAEDPHQELVVVALAGDERVRAFERRDRNDAVERLDEVRVHARPIETEPAAVELLQRVGQCGLCQVRVLPEELKRHRISARNSRRRSASSS
jgi:hypothetical protein